MAHLKPTMIANLMPTQFTVGMREVAFKRDRWRGQSNETAERYLSAHVIPVVLGPEARPYVLDRHHLSRALFDEGVTAAPISVVDDLSRLSHCDFWNVLECRKWCRPFDHKGERRDFGDMPKSLSDLSDDHFRSLAGALKRAGGYAKDKSPFSEFRWADFLRGRISHKLVVNHFDRALAQALALARTYEARNLPGSLSGSRPGADALRSEPALQLQEVAP
jgi:hypothetical protein